MITRIGANNSQGAIILDPRDPMRSARTLLASRFLAPNGERLLHRHRGEFWRFSGSCYVRADNETIRAEAWQFLEQARLQENGHPPFRPTGARVSDMLDAMQSVCHLDGRLEPPAWLDSSGARPAAEYMPVANGLLHLPSGTLDKPTPRYFGIGAAEVAYDPKAPEPARWRAFLDELFVDDEEAISTLQDWFGYTLSPDTSQQKIMLIVGPTRSGKGTIARVLIALIGRDNVAAPTLAALQTNFGLAPLIGKSLAVISDARLGGRSDQAAIAERLLSIPAKTR